MAGTLAGLELSASDALGDQVVDREAFEQAAAAYHGLTVESMRDARLSNGSYRQPTLARDWAFFQLGAAHART